jgi:hypothetical protein
MSERCELFDYDEESQCYSKCHEVTSRDHECWDPKCPSSIKHNGILCPLRNVCSVHGLQKRKEEIDHERH